jgi:hypothetical protein
MSILQQESIGSYEDKQCERSDIPFDKDEESSNSEQNDVLIGKK